MIAYNEKRLYNKYVHSQAAEALQEECITPEAYQAICKAKETGFYTPNFFVRIGLALLTFVITVFVSGLLALMFSPSGSSISFLLVFMGIACYAVAEMLIDSKSHYNSGVDNMLVWMAALLLSAGICWSISSASNGPSIFSFVIFIICFVLALRFADTLLSTAAAVALLCFLFFCYQHTGAFAQTTTPFIMMLASGSLYFVSSKAVRSTSLLLYRNCLVCVNIVALVALYMAGNYYFVREVSFEMGMFHSGWSGHPGTLAMGWIFWAWTFLVPLIYIGAGIRNKNITLIRTGIPLIAVAVLTFRYYHSIIAPEIAMLLGGGLLFIVSYSLINYLRVPKNGFTFQPENFIVDRPDIGKLVTSEFINKAAAGTPGKE
jgi:hypothetical protein